MGPESLSQWSSEGGDRETVANIPYSNWTWPDVEGLHSFKGTLIHTARWPEEFDHRGKVLAVIGNGSTGVQLVPEIQPGKQLSEDRRENEE
jgi:cation diffusion facilitator CzcD-associated flavoprotein CzcO